MSQSSQTIINKYASILAAMGVLCYIASYIPSLMAWWEETRYPHGRELRLVEPVHADVFVLTEPAEASEINPNFPDESQSFRKEALMGSNTLTLPAVTKATHLNDDQTGV